jgi:hypothetical protein
MSALFEHLDKLLGALGSIGLRPPSGDMRIVEIGSGLGIPHVRREALRRPSEYEARFEELLEAGYPWLNMSCYGVHEGLLVVAIEVPSPRRLTPGHATSVNLSGPARIVLDHQWCVDAVLTIDCRAGENPTPTYC